MWHAHGTAPVGVARLRGSIVDYGGVCRGVVLVDGSACRGKTKRRDSRGRVRPDPRPGRRLECDEMTNVYGGPRLGCRSCVLIGAKTRRFERQREAEVNTLNTNRLIDAESAS